MLRRVIPDVVENQDLLTIAGAESVLTAVRRMAEREVRSILVVDRNSLMGVFTGTDLIGRVVAAGLSPQKTAVATVMTPDPTTITPQTLAIEATIGHMKTDGRLDRNWLLGHAGDAMNALLAAAGHNLRLILNAIALWLAWIWTSLQDNAAQSYTSPTANRPTIAIA